MITEQQLSDNELLRQMLEGDEQALAALYRRRQGGIYRFALQMSGSRALSEDITQEVFMILMREGRTFDSHRGSLNAFLLGIARNLVRQRLARERFYAPLDEGSDDGPIADGLQTDRNPLDEVARGQMVETVRKAVLSLPPRYREIVVLCDLQEMSYVEAAEVLGCAVGTVRSRLHRARSLLLEKLRPAREEETAADVRSARCFA
jgi:RNA polymerase sigma-70 factor, ECF subfamily